MPLPPSPAAELRLSDHATRQVWYQLLMISVFLVMFVPFFVTLVMAVMEPQPPNNRVFGILGSTFVALLVVMSGHYWLLFAIHVRVAKLEGNAVQITRFLAPAVRISSNHAVPSRTVATPSFDDRGYQSGRLFMAGTSSFYIPNSFPEAHQLAAWAGQENGA